MNISSLDSFAFNKGLETLIMRDKPVESEKKLEPKSQTVVKPAPVTESTPVAEEPKVEKVETPTFEKKRNKEK